MTAWIRFTRWLRREELEQAAMSAAVEEPSDVDYQAASELIGQPSESVIEAAETDREATGHVTDEMRELHDGEGSGTENAQRRPVVSGKRTLLVVLRERSGFATSSSPPCCLTKESYFPWIVAS